MAFAGLFVVGAVVGLSAVSSNATSSAVNANRNKGQLAAVPGVMEKTQEVLNMTSGEAHLRSLRERTVEHRHLLTAVRGKNDLAIDLREFDRDPDNPILHPHCKQMRQQPLPP